MQRIRVHPPRVRREHPRHEVLPPDPRDPDVVRAKALTRPGDRAGGTTLRQSRSSRPAGTFGDAPLRLARYLPVAIVCAVLVSCSSAHSSHAPTGAAASTASSVSAGAPPRTGNVHLTDYTNNDSTTSSVILTGVVGDYGTAKGDDAKGQLDLDLSRGSFRLDIADLDGRLLALMRHLAVNQHSCSAEATASARVPIVPGTGTGAYSTVRGTFDLTITLDELYHPGACQETAPYLAQEIVTAGWGSISHG